MNKHLPGPHALCGPGRGHGRDSAIPTRLIHSFIHSGARGAPEAGRGVPPLSLPAKAPRLGFSPAKRVQASFSSIVQEGISRSSPFLPTRFQLAQVGEVRFGQRPPLSPCRPTRFWKRPSSVLYLQPGHLLLLLQGALSWAGRPFGDPGLCSGQVPSCKHGSLPKKQPAEGPGLSPPTPCIKDSFFISLSTTHWPRRIRDCAPPNTEPPPTPENLPAQRVPAPKQTQNPTPGQPAHRV